MIAMAMAANPEILIADEPTTALDVTVQKNILDLMKDLQRRYGMSLIFITHDLALIRNFADTVLVMFRGKGVEYGRTEPLFEAPKHPYTKGLLQCRPAKEIRLKRLPTIQYFLGQETNFVAEAETQEERRLRHKAIYESNPLMEVRHLETKFASGGLFSGGKQRTVTAVDGVSFCIYPGETLGIVGESGCGKTTLGRTLLQLVKKSSGEVFFEGKELNGLSGEELKKLRKEIQIVFQDPYSSLNPRIMTGTAIQEPMKVLGIIKNKEERKLSVIELLRKVGLDESYYYRYPHELSGGQRQRICLARALGVQPKLVVCDESVSSLDASVAAQVLNLLNDLKREFGFTYLFISHDLSVVRFMSDRLIVMKSGKIEESGDPDSIYRHPQSPYTRKLLESIPEI